MNENIKYEDLLSEFNQLKNEVDELQNKLECYSQENSNNSLHFLSKQDVLNIEDVYYDESRWNTYYEEMIEELKKFKGINKVLEIGPYKAPFIENSDVIDRVDFSQFFPFAVNKVIVHDCSQTPFPVGDKEYDLVIASQVLEHLGYRGEQVDIIKDIARISKKAIIGLPYKWYRPFDRDHHMIDENVFNDWAGEFKHIYERKSDMTIIRVYDFGD